MQYFALIIQDLIWVII